MDRFFVQLLAYSSKTSTPYLRNLTRLQLIGSFGLTCPNDKIITKLFILDSRNQRKIGPIFLKFSDMNQTSVIQSEFPKILKQVWSNDEQVYFKENGSVFLIVVI